MELKSFLTISILCLMILHGETCNDIEFPDRETIQEDAPVGTVIFEVNDTDGSSPQWAAKQLDPNFSFTYTNGTYRLSLIKQIRVNCTKEIFVTTRFVCGNQTQNVNVTVRFHDRYPPTWVSSKVKNHIQVREDMLTGVVVLDLGGAVDDKDCYHDNVIQVSPYIVAKQFDASEYFTINATTDQVYLSRPFDYDMRYCDTVFKKLEGQFYFNLEVFPKNSRGNVDRLQVRVTFTDVDDEPPVFLKDSSCAVCISKCKTTSKTYTAHLVTGEVKSFTIDVKARDFDTENADLDYRTVDVRPATLSDYVDVDSTNGTVLLKLSPEIISNATDASGVDNVNIILQVIEKRTKQISRNLNLTVILGTPTKPAVTSDDDVDYKLPDAILVIVIVVVGVALILFAVITIVRVRRAPNATVYRVKGANPANNNLDIDGYVQMHDMNFTLNAEVTTETTGQVNNSFYDDEGRYTPGNDVTEDLDVDVRDDFQESAERSRNAVVEEDDYPIIDQDNKYDGVIICDNDEASHFPGNGSEDGNGAACGVCDDSEKWLTGPDEHLDFNQVDMDGGAYDVSGGEPRDENEENITENNLW